ncbi:MAG: hypothetical protein U0L52_04315 [Bacteroidaceae bacterium]|nr:hypothetical protein [Bacteroidaceae bacterium]
MADFILTQSGDQVQGILNNAAMQEALADETARAEAAEQQLQTNINAEAGARQQADTTLQGNIDTEEARAKAAEQLNADDIDAIEAKIPDAASDENQLVDEQKMNSSIATATATYRGSFNLVTDLHLTVTATEADIANALAATISGADNNDYCFVQVPVANDKPTEIARVERYKFNGTVWAFEYALNNSGFTADQWNALNSGITSGLVAKLTALPTSADLTALFANIYTKSETNGVVATETQRAQNAEQANADNIDAIEAKIPADASTQNKLASEQYVNSSVATNTATFKGAYNLVSDLSLSTAATREQIATALAGAISQADNNDYCFVQIPTSDATPMEIASVERYKFNGTAWAFEYALNNSGFTSAQWNALNSGITSGLVAKLSALPTNAELTNLLAGKQAVIVDLDAIRSGAQAGAVSAPQATTYTKTEVDGIVNAEETRAQAAEQQNADDIDAIEAKIPAAASAQNKLATEGFVNSSVATATATYRGSFNLVSDLSLTISATEQQIATALAGEITGADNNDYCFVQIPAADATPTVIARVDRYKFDGTAWSFEYSLNNSGFTAAQWDAINSSITSGLVTKLSDLPTNAELTALLQGKQAVIADLAAIRSGAQAGASAYQKPSSGIPETDLTVELQLALASFITATAQNLAYYYLKSETYSASQVDQMLAAIRQFQYEAVQTLPTPSAQTVGKIYLVPSADPQTQNTKDEYITLTITEEGTTTYAWEQIGSTDIDLSNYYTKAQADAAITAALNTALAAYSTTSQVSTMISTAINSALQAYATKEYVASQVQEYAGTFRGTYDTLAELEATTGNHHNDYAWVKVTDSDGDNDYDRYKFNGTAWVFEYRLNNTHFTADELAAIRSGMTTAKREKLDNMPATTSSSIAATTGAATISGAKKFFVGTQGQDGRWTLESLTPDEMQKCAYAYLAGATVGNTPAHLQGTDANGNPQRITPSDLASLLGALTFKEILSGCTDNMVDGLIGQVRFDNYSGYDGTYTAAMDYGVLLTFSNIGGYSLQLMYSMGTGTRKYRMANTVTWLEWNNF